MGVTLVVAIGANSVIVALGLLNGVASLVVEQGLGPTGFSCCSSWALEHRLHGCGARG